MKLNTKQNKMKTKNQSIYKESSILAKNCKIQYFSFIYELLANDALLDLYDFKKISKTPAVQCLKAAISEEGYKLKFLSYNFVSRIKFCLFSFHRRDFCLWYARKQVFFIYLQLMTKYFIYRTNLLSRSLNVISFVWLPERNIAVAHENIIEIISTKSNHIKCFSY